MDPGEHTSQNSSCSFFDVPSIFSSSTFSTGSATTSLAFPHLAHMPSAFSMLGCPPTYPIATPFGGLGALSDGLINPLRTSMSHSLNPTSGGADWWRAAAAASNSSSSSSSEHACRLAAGGRDYFAGSLSNYLPPNLVVGPDGSLLTADLLSGFNIGPKTPLLHAAFTLSGGTSGSFSSEAAVTKSTTTVATVSTTTVTSSASSSSSTSDCLTSVTNAVVTKNSVVKSKHQSAIQSGSFVPSGEKNQHKNQNGPSSSDSESQSNISSGSLSVSSEDISALSDSSDEGKNKGNSEPASTSKKGNLPGHQIDGTKKKLIADQIRQKMQTKPVLVTPLIVPSSKSARQQQQRGRGRPPKKSTHSSAPQDLKDQVKEQERTQLETEVQYHQFLTKHAKEKETAIKLEKWQESEVEKEKTTFSSNEQQDIIARFKTLSNNKSSNSSSSEDDSDIGSDSESESSSESGSNSSEMGESDDDQSARDSASSSSKGHKRAADMNSVLSPHKRQKIIDETELRIPLEHGWQRQTKIHSIGQRGITGEVTYFAPCSKKLRTYPDVMRYLEKNGITDLTRENFSFSTKVPVGEFLEARPEENQRYVLLSEHEMFDRLSLRQTKKWKQHFSSFIRNKSGDSTTVDVKSRKPEQHEATRKAAEIKLEKKMEKQKQREISKKAKQIKVLEKRHYKEQEKHFKQQEKLKRQERLRIEREMRAQQLLEERELKRQQTIMMREQERERRRQHMLLVKALEARRRQEEKERLKEEKLVEKQMNKERKLNQKRLELQIAQELKKPAEDMEIQDTKSLPEFPRIAGLRLPGAAFADCLMVIEFLHNFGKALGITEDSIPALNTLQSGLLNETEDDVDEFISLALQLLKSALIDPGVPSPKEAVTKLGQKIIDVHITESVLCEILRIFVIARNGGENEISCWLAERPLEAFNATQKAAVLAFLCNELLCGRIIANEIDRNIEAMSNLRRDKWIVEGKLRRLKMIQGRKFNHQSPKLVQESSSSLMDDESQTLQTPGNKHDTDEDEESGNDSDATNSTNIINISEGEEEDPASLEECEKKIEKLSKQHSQYRNKVFEASFKLRSVCFGQDRFKRKYWLLPYTGGLYVEGLQSAEKDDCALCMDVLESADIDYTDKTEKKDFPTTDNTDPVSDNNEENNSTQCCSNLEHVRTEENFDHCKKTSNSTKEEENINLFLQKPESTNLKDLMYIPKTESSCDSKIFVNNVHTTGCSSFPTTSLSNSAVSSNSEIKPSFVSIDSLLKKDSESNNSLQPFLPPVSFPVPPLLNDHLLKIGTDLSEQKPWFSILPRMPCDETTLTRSPLNMSQRMLNNSPFFFHPLPFHAFPVRSPTFQSFQMGQIQGSPVDFNLNMLSNGSGSSNCFFKVPSVPEELPLPAGSRCESKDSPKTFQCNAQPIPIEMQYGWWRLTDVDQLKLLIKCLHPRGIRERMLQKSLQKYFDYTCIACSKEVRSDVKFQEKKGFQPNSQTGAPDPDTNDSWLLHVAHEIEAAILEEIEMLEGRVYTASLQVKGWKLPPKAATAEEEEEEEEEESDNAVDDSVHTEKGKHKQCLLEIAKDRLLNLEKNIERRYLKPPLCKSVQISLANITSHSDSHQIAELEEEQDEKEEEEDVPPGLAVWRKGVLSAHSPAQLTLCTYQLNTSIAWEKSIMKVLCQICRKDDNEAELLLCDGCDKGYHTYCFKPKMETIPEGDWYCFECISKATGVPCCMVCGKKNGKLVLCDECPRAFHIDCLIPPLPRLPKKWICPSCIAEKGTKKGKRGRRKSEAKKERRDSDGSRSETLISERKKNPDLSREMAPCRVILLELEKSDDGWPFLQPVNCRQFPSYKKYIKKPMDFSTLRAKLKDNVYKSKSEFVADVRLVFDNCETFNEDDSEVGQAGHSMRRMFEKRWKQLCEDDS